MNLLDVIRYNKIRHACNAYVFSKFIIYIAEFTKASLLK